MSADFPILSIEDAAARHWDVVIAGSSFAAMFFLHGLPAGLSVLVIEKGVHQTHADQTQQGINGRESFVQNNYSAEHKDWVAHTAFGGNSNCWWACTPRFHPRDFVMLSSYGVGEDWPLTYSDIEPFYEEVEDIMEISGGGSDHILPRRKPFPFPPHIPSRSDKILRAHSKNWFAQPTARSNGGSRPICCTNGVCTICPVDAKFTMTNSGNQFQRDGLYTLIDTEVRAVRTEAGRATGVEVIHADSRHEITADLVALGTNAIFNAAILLRSGVVHDRLGRGLNEQSSRYAVIDGPGLGYYGGTSITGHGYDLYDGDHRRDVSGTLIEVYNAPVSLRRTKGRWGERMRLKLIVEDLPHPDNRVILEEDEPILEWHGAQDYATKGLERAMERLPDILPFEAENIGFSDLAPTEAHILCTHPIGNDPTRHVTGDDLQLHSVQGLYALGGGAFPTISPSNPTLTLSALSLRAGRILA